MLIYMRRMDLPPEQMALIRAHWEAGKPIVGLRTASHAFQKDDIAVFSKVLGGEYQGPGSYTAPFRALIADGQEKHPILQGVGAIDSRGPYRFILAGDAVVLQVIESDKKEKAAVSWVHEHNGGRTFFSLMGVPEDFKKDEFRRLLANALFWTARRDVAKK
jgi:type 1 glutamine amidotransferase